jgi:hypothetical protein
MHDHHQSYHHLHDHHHDHQHDHHHAHHHHEQHHHEHHHGHHQHHRKGFGYSSYQPPFASDRNGDGLITEADFVISARERGWGCAGE